MRTNIEIDDRLMREALRLTGLRTKRELVDLAQPLASTTDHPVWSEGWKRRGPTVHAVSVG
jgi:putative antitoxin of VapBC-like toxin-antitoxin system